MVAKENQQTQIINKLTDVMQKYIECLELYTKAVKDSSGNKRKTLLATQKLIHINQKIHAVTKELSDTKKRC